MFVVALCCVALVSAQLSIDEFGAVEGENTHSAALANGQALYRALYAANDLTDGKIAIQTQCMPYTHYRRAHRHHTVW